MIIIRPARVRWQAALSYSVVLFTNELMIVPVVLMDQGVALAALQ